MELEHLSPFTNDEIGAFNYVGQILLNRPPETNRSFYSVLEQEGFDYDICCLRIFTDESMSKFMYTDPDTNKQCTIVQSDLYDLQVFADFLCLQSQHHNINGNWKDVIDINPYEFDAWRRNYVSSTNPNVTPSSSYCAPRTTAHPASAQPFLSPNELFRNGIKRNPLLFPVLDTNSEYRQWKQQTISIANALLCAEITTPSYTPSTFEDRQLFQQKQDYMYTVLQYSLQTPVGMDLLCIHAEQHDAQAILAQLDKFYMSIETATTKAQQLELQHTVQVDCIQPQVPIDEHLPVDGEIEHDSHSVNSTVDVILANNEPENNELINNELANNEPVNYEQVNVEYFVNNVHLPENGETNYDHRTESTESTADHIITNTDTKLLRQQAMNIQQTDVIVTPKCTTLLRHEHMHQNSHPIENQWSFDVWGELPSLDNLDEDIVTFEHSEDEPTTVVTEENTHSPFASDVSNKKQVTSTNTTQLSGKSFLYALVLHAPWHHHVIQQQIAEEPPSEAPPPEPPPHCTSSQSKTILPNGEILPMNGEIDLVIQNTNKILNEPIQVSKHPTAPHIICYTMKRKLDNYQHPDIFTRTDSMHNHRHAQHNGE